MNEEVMFHIVVPGRDHSAFLGKNLDVLLNQTYQNWRAIVTIDGKTEDNDKAYEIAERYANRDKRIIVCYEKERVWGLANIIHGFSLLAVKFGSSKYDVLMEVDGDDWLDNIEVLNKLAKIYENPDTWLTYGSHYRTQGVVSSLRMPIVCQEHKDWVWKEKSFRSAPWWSSQLRTFRRFLWDNIEEKDFLDPEGNYWKRAWDLAWMFPMLEMCEKHNVVVIPDMIYAYNVHPKCNFMMDGGDAQRKNEWIIRSRPKYPYYKDMT